jgi:hypothetical protein
MTFLQLIALLVVLHYWGYWGIERYWRRVLTNPKNNPERWSWPKYFGVTLLYGPYCWALNIGYFGCLMLAKLREVW